MKGKRGRKEMRNYSTHSALSIHTALSTSVKLSKNKFRKGLKILHLQNITTKKQQRSLEISNSHKGRKPRNNQQRIN